MGPLEKIIAQFLEIIFSFFSFFFPAFSAIWSWILSIAYLTVTKIVQSGHSLGCKYLVQYLPQHLIRFLFLCQITGVLLTHPSAEGLLLTLTGIEFTPLRNSDYKIAGLQEHIVESWFLDQKIFFSWKMLCQDSLLNLKLKCPSLGSDYSGSFLLLLECRMEISH